MEKKKKGTKSKKELLNNIFRYQINGIYSTKKILGVMLLETRMEKRLVAFAPEAATRSLR